MRDLERILRDALRRQGDDYEPRDPYGARAVFVERLRKRRRLMYLRASGAFVAAVLLAVLVFPGTLTESEPDLDLAGVRPEVVATVAVGGAPTSSSAAADGSVWVATGRDVVAIDPEVDGIVRNARTAGWSDEVATTEDHVWVSTREGYLYLVDPQSGAVVSRTTLARAQPVDIAARGDSLWAVGMTDGRLYELSASSGEPEPTSGSGSDEDAEGGEDDPASVPDVAEDEGLELDQHEFVNMPLTDVAVGDAGLWVLFRNEDSAGVFQVDPDDLTGGAPISVEVGDNADLAVGLHAVWVATGTNGTVERIDARTGEITASVEVGGRYTDIAVGEGVLWAVTGGDGPSQLYQIGADGDFIGEPLELDGDPVDVAVGAGAVWVSDQDNGEVLRIESRSSDQDPTPITTPTPTPGLDLDARDMFFVHSADGDLYGREADGSIRQLTDTPDLDVLPTMDQYARRVAFQRLVPHPDQEIIDCARPLVLGSCIEKSLIVSLDPGTNTEEGVGEGVSPTLGGGGRLVWFETSDEGLPQAIVIGDPSTSFSSQSSYPLSGDSDFTEVRNLHWAEPATVDHEFPVLHFTGFREGWGLYEIKIPSGHAAGEEVEIRHIAPVDIPPGSEIVAAAASVDGSGVDVLALCCRATVGDRFSYAALGRVAPVEGDYEDLTGEVGYNEIRRIVDEEDMHAFDLEGGTWDFDPLRTWAPTEQNLWARGETPGAEERWLVTDGDEMWVFGASEFGASIAESEGERANFWGLAVNPTR